MARRLVVAQWQNIVYNEYLPIILGRTTHRVYGLGVEGFTEYNSHTDPAILNSFTTAAYRSQLTTHFTTSSPSIQLSSGLATVLSKAW